MDLLTGSILSNDVRYFRALFSRLRCQEEQNDVIQKPRLLLKKQLIVLKRDVTLGYRTQELI